MAQHGTLYFLFREAASEHNGCDCPGLSHCPSGVYWYLGRTGLWNNGFSLSLGVSIWAGTDGEGFGWEKSEKDDSLSKESCLNKAME